jgi:hypothetical protein
VQRGPSGEVMFFRLMSQHTLRGLMYEAAKYSREMADTPERTNQSTISLVELASRPKDLELFGLVCLGDTSQPSASDRMSAMLRRQRHNLSHMNFFVLALGP